MILFVQIINFGSIINVDLTRIVQTTHFNFGSTVINKYFNLGNTNVLQAGLNCILLLFLSVIFYFCLPVECLNVDLSCMNIKKYIKDSQDKNDKTWNYLNEISLIYYQTVKQRVILPEWI